MNKRQRASFIKGLINAVKEELIKENDKYPDYWDGIELRERIKAGFSGVAWIKNTPRKKRYLNYCRTKGLFL